MDYRFDVKQATEQCIEWIRNWFQKNGKNCKAVIGISGGVDSSVAAALCVEALGKDRVIGVLMPNHIQDDIEYSHMLCNHLGIKNYTVDVGIAIDDLLNNLHYRLVDMEISEQTKVNLPARIRMATLYAVSQSCNGRVANTCNLSEDWIGYSTRYGDSVGDFSPLSKLTKTEVKQLGRLLDIPEDLVNKVPSDGLCGESDEERFGFTYDVLDKYIRTGEIEDTTIKNKIDRMHEKNLFKLELMPCFEYIGE